MSTTRAKTFTTAEQNKLLEKKETLKTYLLMKLEEEDWHGVEDAASDIRDVEAALAVLNALQAVL